jgi:glycosyltransferase involved in cell wall biosynthesis
MKRPVVYLLPHVSRVGGVKVVLEHVAGLTAKGWDARLWHLTGEASWFGKPHASRRFGSTDELGAALKALTPKVAVATWWQTNDWVMPNLRPGDSGFALTQDLDALTYSRNPDGRPYKLPLTYLTESEFVRRELKDRHGTDSVQIGIGIDHSAFASLPALRERYRVLTPCRHFGNTVPADLKGWGTAQDAVRRLKSREPLASCVTFGNGPCQPLGFVPHIHVQGPSDRHLRHLYCQSGVFLAASRREGFGLPGLEALACGCPLVCTKNGGMDEYAIHGVTALVAPVDDAQALAEHLKTVMSDPGLAQALGRRGVEMAANYRWGPVISKLEELYSN